MICREFFRLRVSPRPFLILPDVWFGISAPFPPWSSPFPGPSAQKRMSFRWRQQRPGSLGFQNTPHTRLFSSDDLRAAEFFFRGKPQLPGGNAQPHTSVAARLEHSSCQLEEWSVDFDNPLLSLSSSIYLGFLFEKYIDLLHHRNAIDISVYLLVYV